jgi:hypothetical protein
MTETDFDLNKAGTQRSFEVIPENTVCTLQMKIRAGGAGGPGDQGWPKRAGDSLSEAIDCECTVVDGDYAGRKVWQLLTIRGTTPGHAQAGEISMRFFRALYESAKGIRSDDKSEAAEKARKSVAGWGDFNGLRFMARIGVRPAQGNYAAKNTILEVITPERQEWRQPEQLLPSSIASAAPATAPAAAPAPAGAIARPAWMNKTPAA